MNDIKLDYVDRLMRSLKTNGVASYRETDAGIEVTFFPPQAKAPKVKARSKEDEIYGASPVRPVPFGSNSLAALDADAIREQAQADHDVEDDDDE